MKNQHDVKGAGSVILLLLLSWLFTLIQNDIIFDLKFLIQ